MLWTATPKKAATAKMLLLVRKQQRTTNAHGITMWEPGPLPLAVLLWAKTISHRRTTGNHMAQGQ